MKKTAPLLNALLLSALLTGAAQAQPPAPQTPAPPEWAADLLEDSLDGAGCAVFVIALRRCALLAPNRRRVALCVLETFAVEGAGCAGRLKDQLQKADFPFPASQ